MIMQFFKSLNASLESVHGFKSYHALELFSIYDLK